MEIPQQHSTGKAEVESVHINSVVNIEALGGDGCDQTTKNEVPLNSPEGDIIFLRALILFRRMYYGKNHSAAHVQVLCEIGRHGVKSNIPAVAASARRTHFRDNVYNRKKKMNIVEYPHWQALGVIFGDASIETLEGTEYDIREENNNSEVVLNNPQQVACMAAALSGG